MIGFKPGTNPLSLYDELRTLAAPVTTFVSGGKFADRSQAMDQNLKNAIMSQYDKTGIMSGALGYSDFDKSQTPGTAFPNLDTMRSNLLSGKMSPAQFANATTLGRLTYDIDPNTGKVTFGSNAYNFDPANAVIDPSDSFGAKAFSYLAGKANERNREINPNISIPVDYLRGFARDFSEFGDPDSFRSRMSNNRFDELPSTRQTSSPRAAGAEDIKEEGIFSLSDILADLGRKGVEGFKDVASRGIASQALGGAGGVLLGPMGALAGGITGLLGGGDLFNTNTLSQRSFDMRSPEAQTYASGLYGPGGLLEGYNQFSAFGKGAAGTLDKSIGRIMRTLQKKDSPFLQDRLGKLQKARDKITGTIRDSSGTITGGSGQGTIDSGNTGGYGGTGGEGPSAVSSSGMLGGGV